MKIKRYMDKDMRGVLRRVREDQGPDAVILSNRRVDEGIEVIAAIDYDEALMRHALGTADTNEVINREVLEKLVEDDAPAAPSDDIEVVSSTLEEAPIPRLRDNGAGDLTLEELRSELSSMRGMLETQLSGLMWKDASRRFPLRAQVLRNLANIGVAPDVANMVLDRLGPLDELKSLWQAPLATLAQTLPVVDDSLLNKGGTIALIGPTGVGKTTTIAKIAANFAIHDWADDIALVSADSYRIGAKEHLAAFANIIGTKVYSVSNFDELSQTLDKLRNKKLVLIDTEGRSQRDKDLSSRLAAYGRTADRVQFYLTVSATTQEPVLDETVREFKRVPLSGCIVTKIDEAAQLGCVISTLVRHELPAAYFADGQRIPEDLHAARNRKLWLVNQAVECMEASRVRVNERTMAERYAQQGLVNA